jgi:hypothetical protein
MSLTQIDDELPNGFHDAEIGQIHWNLQQGSIVLEIDFWIGTEDTEPELRRKGRVELQEVFYFAIDPPAPRQLDPKPLRPMRDTLAIDGIPTSEEILPSLANLKAALPDGINCFSFYVSNWNSFIHVAAGLAKLTWADSE